MEKVKLVIPKKSEYISTIRLATSALLNINNFNVDDIEDLKVIVSEVCIFFINSIVNNEKPFEVDFYIEPNNFKVEVKDLNVGKINEEDNNSEMCLLIIQSLSDKYEINLENKIISFEKYIK